MTETTERYRRQRKPGFQKGQSGNPGGRPTVYAEAQTLLGTDLDASTSRGLDGTVSRKCRLPSLAVAAFSRPCSVVAHTGSEPNTTASTRPIALLNRPTKYAPISAQIWKRAKITVLTDAATDAKEFKGKILKDNWKTIKEDGLGKSLRKDDFAKSW